MGRVHQENAGLLGAEAPRGFAGANLHIDTLRFYLAGDSFNDTAPNGAKLTPSFVGPGIAVSGDSMYLGGRSLLFPGGAANQLITYAHNASLDLGGGDWTVACRVKWTGDASHYNAIFAKRQTATEYEGYLNVGTGTVDYYNGGNFSTGTTPLVRDWCHLAWQFKNGTGLRIYRDGQQIGSFNVTTTTSGTNHFVVGGVSGLFEPFDGLIQDLAIWRSLPWGFEEFTPPSLPVLPVQRATGPALGGILQLGSQPIVGTETVVTDLGPGAGFTVAQGADAANVTGFTNTGMTTYKVNTDNQGVNGAHPLAYTCSASSYVFHTGHQPSWWPAYYAINVSTAQYGKVLNQLQWLMHQNMVGNCDMFGSNQAITADNFTNETLWTHIGRVHMGGANTGAADCTVRTANFNPAGFGYRWYMIKMADNNSSYLPYPQTGLQTGWAAMGLRLNKI